MKIYLVGGAVRDQLLGLPVHERDWVVTGTTPEQMVAIGYRPVGKDFPVFLHPETHEEYALARTERKTGRGYKGFTFNTSPEVTLTEDLKRRDLTINAIAMDEHGQLIDPYGGQNDLQKKILRHVSPAFVEDPVRLLRLARFAARFPEFSIAPETLDFLRDMVSNNEVAALVPERIWQELIKALQTKHPEKFITALRLCNALAIIFPELEKLFPAPGESLLALLQKICQEETDLKIRFAVLTHQLTNDFIAFSKRYKIPKEFHELATLTIQYAATYSIHKNLNAEQVLMLLEKTDALRRPARFQLFLKTCHLIFDQPNAYQFFQTILKMISEAPLQDLLAKQLPGPQLAQAIRERRLEIISLFLT